MKAVTPQDSWDSHMHVLDWKYPLVPEAQYVPHEASVEEATEALGRAGIANMVFVQPSIYGNDNSCLLAALEAVGAKNARGVVQFDPETISMAQLRAWHQLGVRGVRLNLKSVDKVWKISELSRHLVLYANCIRDLGWVLDLHIDMHLLPDIYETVANLNIKVCLDHLAYPRLERDPDDEESCTISVVPGLTELLDLMKCQTVDLYVKLSGLYRLKQAPDGIEHLVKRLLQDPYYKRMVFATDWPHTRFDGYDFRPFMEQCITWCEGDQKLLNAIFRDNAKKLWSVA